MSDKTMKIILNMKKISLIAVCLSCLLVVGCEAPQDDKKTGETKVGTVLNAEIVPTTFNESHKTRIETTGGVFVVYGIVSVFKGKSARLDTYDNGRSYLCIEDRGFCSFVIGR